MKKRALITGANRGIGFEIARQLGARGFDVIISGRSLNAVNEAAQKLRSLGCNADPLVMDVSNRESIQEAYQQMASQGTRIDVLINNAGILLDETTPLLQITEAEWIQTFNTNAFGPFFTVQKFLPLLSRGSRVINISSSGGQICEGISTWSPVYCISKTTLNAITLQLAEVLKRSGILVNAVCPGWVNTDMGGASAPDDLPSGADTAVWLATEENSGATGCFFRNREKTHW